MPASVSANTLARPGTCTSHSPVAAPTHPHLFERTNGGIWAAIMFHVLSHRNVLGRFGRRSVAGGRASVSDVVSSQRRVRRGIMLMASRSRRASYWFCPMWFCHPPPLHYCQTSFWSHCVCVISCHVGFQTTHAEWVCCYWSAVCVWTNFCGRRIGS